MQQYWVEGLFVTKKGLQKAHKNRQIAPTDIEPFYRSFWANSQKEALQAATEQLDGGQWTEGPVVSQISEEERMRALGAPELPGLGKASKSKK